MNISNNSGSYFYESQRLLSNVFVLFYIYSQSNLNFLISE